MLKKLFDFFVSVIKFGVFNFFFAIPVCIVAHIALGILSVPLSYVIPDVYQDTVIGVLFSLASYSFVFSILLISDLLDNYNLPSLKTLSRWLWGWFKNRPKHNAAI